MLSLLIRVALILLGVYLLIALVVGGYQQVLAFYWWMRP